MKHLESHEQQTLIRWWHLAHRGLGVQDERLLFAVPNGGKRDRVTASILKAEGVRAGVPDLFLAVPSARLDSDAKSWILRHGLFIEMKTDTGRTSPAQDEMLTRLRNQGYAVTVARGWDQARKAIETYLKGGDVK